MGSMNKLGNINDLKRQALEYFLMKPDITKKVEDALNDLFYAEPEDAYGFLADFFKTFATSPIIAKIEASSEVYYDAKSQPILYLDIYCKEKNITKSFARIEIPYSNSELVNDSSRISLIQDDDLKRKAELNDLMAFINNDVTSLVKSCIPSEQKLLDDSLRNFYEAKQKDYVQANLAHMSESPDSALKQAAKEAELKQQQQQQQNDKNKKPPTKSPASPLLKNNSKSLAGPDTNSLIVAGDENQQSQQLQQQLQSKANVNFIGLHTLSAVSKAICLCSLHITNKQPFLYIHELRNQAKEVSNFKVPKLMVTVLQNGKGFYGKQMLIKEFILFTKANISARESIELINKVNIYLRDLLYQTKQSPGPVNRSVTDMGSLHCPLETPLHGLDLLESAIQASLGENAAKINIGLGINAFEIFDSDKMKYEIVNGIMKSGEELIDIYTELITKYPRITMLLDPFSKKDGLIWFKLHSKIGKMCLITNTIVASDVNAFTAPNSSVYASEESFESSRASFDSNLILMQANFFKYESAFTITDFLKNVDKTRSQGLLNGLTCSTNETSDAFLTDLAVGCQADFLKVGGFFRSERVQKINRLIEIEQYLSENNSLSKDKEVELITRINDIELQISEKFSKLLQQSEENKGLKKK